MSVSILNFVASTKMHRKVKLFSSKDVDRFSKMTGTSQIIGYLLLKVLHAIRECETFQTVEAGDHTILLGSVTNILTEKKSPLLYHRRHIGPIPSEFYAPM